MYELVCISSDSTSTNTSLFHSFILVVGWSETQYTGMATVYGETERGIVGTVRTRVSTNKVCLIETNPALSFHGT